MKKNIIKRFLNDRGEINMIAIVLILVVVIILAAIFKDSMIGLLKTIFDRITNDIKNF